MVYDTRTLSHPLVPAIGAVAVSVKETMLQGKRKARYCGPNTERLSWPLEERIEYGYLLYAYAVAMVDIGCDSN